MPQFAPGEVKSARAPITVQPSGLSCSAELYLVSNGAKVATSGIKLFTSTGAKQDVSFPITMPGEGTYPVYLDIFTNGLLVGAYKAVEDVVIAVVDFVYSDPVNGYHYHTGNWKSPDYECTITNQGTLKGMRIITLTIHRTTSYGYEQKYTESFGLTLEPGQSYRFIYVNEYPCPPWVCDKILLGVGDRVELFLSDNAGGGEGSYVSR